MATDKEKYNFGVIFQKLSEMKKSKEDTCFSQELEASVEISKLREIVLDISEGNEQYFSTT
ncbi:MAG: hypothetical protein A2471_02235 [Omnitrophica WOR_2 bacterium RIFOXYC2_FULL_45_15]|nr:MAG: hypothetical protein A2471_02235 [Omnitrophica WOR_2 bacterium RIFOXYC2_FULL_45_15]